MSASSAITPDSAPTVSTARGSTTMTTSVEKAEGHVDGLRRVVPSRCRMKTQIRPRGMTLSRTQCVRLERDLYLALARFGERIDHVIVEISEGAVAGVKVCAIEVRLKSRILKVESSDTDVFLATEHAVQRVARSVSRAIEIEALLRR